MKLIVGLGNPSEKYETTRHNLGFAVVEALFQKWNLSSQVEKKLQALVFYQKQKKLVLAKPLLMMNIAGLAVEKLVDYFQVKPNELWIIHDDLDLPLGKMKIRQGGGTAGHRGIASIVKVLGTPDFVRFRLGIGHPAKKGQWLVGKGRLVSERARDSEVKSFVLSPFEAQEKDEARRMVKKAVKAIEFALEKGLEKAMNRFNV
jgi:PTH1 family peptidyl-tRNA hydrolase